MNLNIVKVISTRVVDNFRNIKFLRMGKSDIQETEQIGPHGFDSNPVKDMAAIYAPTLQQGEPVILGYINKKQMDLDLGESLMFSTNQNGVLQIYIRMRADGTMEMNGNSDFMVRFNELKTGFDQLKSDFNDFVSNTYNTHVHPSPAGGSTGTTPSLGTPSAASIDNAKIAEIKTSS